MAKTNLKLNTKNYYFAPPFAMPLQPTEPKNTKFKAFQDDLTVRLTLIR